MINEVESKMPKTAAQPGDSREAIASKPGLIIILLMIIMIMMIITMVILVIMIVCI